jgi:hypothetical protein
VKTTVEIPDSLFQEARAWAEARGVPFRQIVEEGLREVIRHSRESTKRFRLRDGSFGGRGRNEDLSWPALRRTIYEGRGE